MVVLDCTAVECTLGDGGDRYQTRDMEMEYAMRMLELHVKNHETVQQQPVQQRVKPETVPRPKLSKGISEDKYVHLIDSGQGIREVSYQESEKRR